MAKSFFIKDEINDHFKLHLRYYITTFSFFVVGLLFGVVLIFSDFNYMAILKTSDNVLYDYITGTANNSLIFYSNLKSLFVFALLIFIFNLATYTSFLSCVLISYQVSLLVLSIKAVISMFGFSGVISCLFFVLPINLLIMFILVIYNSILLRRVFYARRNNLSFIQSFSEGGLYIYIIAIILIFIVLAFIISFILPIFFKSIVFLVY